MNRQLQSRTFNLFTKMILIAFLLSSVRGFTSTSHLPCKVFHRSSFLSFRQNSPHTGTRSSAPTSSRNLISPFHPQTKCLQSEPSHSLSSTTLRAWWNPSGIPQAPSADPFKDTVSVQIERTSPNSRRIMGDICIPVPLEDVWSILTDYDNLAVHVPNLVESRRVGNVNNRGGYPGDGSYQCRLHQRGAQKIIGFEFGASVTMDMQEKFGLNPNGERSIFFKCVDSQFFTEFDGEWTVVNTPNYGLGGQDSSFTTVRYVVDVRPKGPVPVAALEWRIKEDVPVNLKAVKKAALKVAERSQLMKEPYAEQMVVSDLVQTKGARPMSRKNSSVWETVGGQVANVAAAASMATSLSPQQKKMLAKKADWSDDETIGTYLDDWTRDPSFDWYGDETTAAYLDDLAVSHRA